MASSRENFVFRESFTGVSDLFRVKATRGAPNKGDYERLVAATKVCLHDDTVSFDNVLDFIFDEHLHPSALVVRTDYAAPTFYVTPWNKWKFLNTEDTFLAEGHRTIEDALDMECMISTNTLRWKAPNFHRGKLLISIQFKSTPDVMVMRFYYDPNFYSKIQLGQSEFLDMYPYLSANSPLRKPENRSMCIYRLRSVVEHMNSNRFTTIFQEEGLWFRADDWSSSKDERIDGPETDKALTIVYERVHGIPEELFHQIVHRTRERYPSGMSPERPAWLNAFLKRNNMTVDFENEQPIVT